MRTEKSRRRSKGETDHIYQAVDVKVQWRVPRLRTSKNEAEETSGGQQRAPISPHRDNFQAETVAHLRIRRTAVSQSGSVAEMPGIYDPTFPTLNAVGPNRTFFPKRHAKPDGALKISAREVTNRCSFSHLLRSRAAPPNNRLYSIFPRSAFSMFYPVQRVSEI